MVSIITAPIDQIFGIVPSVNSLALYLLDGSLFVGSLEFSSQPLFVEELVAHYHNLAHCPCLVSLVRLASNPLVRKNERLVELSVDPSTSVPLSMNMNNIANVARIYKFDKR